MGIYDREYYRKDGPSYLEALIPSGQVCKWLIAINVLVFILQLVTKQTRESLEGNEAARILAIEIARALKDVAQDPNRRHMSGGELEARIAHALRGPFTEALELDTAKVGEGQVWRLLTYSFLHAPQTWMHIFFNMLFLWLFGSEIERLYGSREFLTFYLLAAVIGGLAFQAQAMIQGTPMFSIGASGAVTAVLVLYAFHFPHQTILLFFVLPIPVWLFAVFQVGQDAFQLFGRVQTSTAVAVHVGGAGFAALYFKFQWRITRLLPGFQAWRRERGKPNLRVYRPEEDLRVPVASGASAELDEHLDAKLDAVLEKLSRHGRESLTESERDVLLKASEIYKKKRT